MSVAIPEHMCWFAGDNSGDLIGPYLYEKWQGKAPTACKHPRSPHGPLFLLTCGSIFQWSSSRAIVWGTGVVVKSGSIAKSHMLQRPHTVHAVRGHITAAALTNIGVECPRVFGDPALLLPLVHTPPVSLLNGDANAQQQLRIGLVPHHVDYTNVARLFANVPNVVVIDICRPPEEVVNDIVLCTHTLSSSLHGIIYSHTYGIATAWSKSIKRLCGDNCKFPDHYSVFYEDFARLRPLKPMDKLTTLTAAELASLIETFVQPDGPIDVAALYDSCPFAPARLQRDQPLTVGRGGSALSDGCSDGVCKDSDSEKVHSATVCSNLSSVDTKPDTASDAPKKK